MNFKIENRVLNIRNYPSVARHLEDMASRGWLINKIILGNIFIYKKIKPESLDFSITPYEVETTFNRKTKAELKEFQTVCETVGWNYATKSDDLHIYYKQFGREAIDIQTDEEDEFNTLERIGKKQIKGSYLLTPLMLYLAWTIVGDLFKDAKSMKNGMGQIVGPFAVVFVISLINDIIKTKMFIKTNRKNIEEGKKIQFRDSKLYFEEMFFSLYILFTSLFIGYSLYVGFVLKNKIILIALIPALISLTIGVFYRNFIKTSRKSISYKKTSFVIVMVVAFFISISISMFGIYNLVFQQKDPFVEGYRILSINDFGENKLEEIDLWQDFSVLIPKSYEFSSMTEKDYLRTHYSKGLTVGLAERLVRRYIKQEEDWTIQLTTNKLDDLFEKGGKYDSHLETYGLTEEDFNSLIKLDKKEYTKQAQRLIKEGSIIKDNKNLWNMDDAYFLNPEKDQIVIRKWKEVFYLSGMDFSDPEIIKTSKEKLELN